MFNKLLFCERLKQLRLEKNISQEQLGHSIKTTKGAIANYENGNRIPGFEIAIDLADFFNVTLDYLLGRSNNRNL